MKIKKYIFPLVFIGLTAGTTISCEDILDKGNEYVIYADGRDLVDPADTVNSVLGIINKLQAIAVRTNLLGDVRADMVALRENATTDLKEIAALDITDDNKYNSPREYYAVINNCNYFLAHADSTAGNTSTGVKYYKAEIAQVHSIRAWTYLQLVLAYGRVPFIDTPIVTKLESDATYPTKDLEGICDYFINDLLPYDNGGSPTDYPNFLSIGGGIDPLMCMFPTQLVLGDLYLWKAVATGKGAGKVWAEKAAKSYYNYIVWTYNDKNGKQLKNYLTTSRRQMQWSPFQLQNGRFTSGPSGSNLHYYSYTGSYITGYNSYADRNWGNSGTEIVTVIPMDSAASDGYYNELRRFYETRKATDWVEACIAPSQVLRDLSKAQSYVDYDNTNNLVEVTADKFTDDEISEGLLGDLRLWGTWYQSDMKDGLQLVNQQLLAKHHGQHIIVYHTSQIYLRLAEALNYAGYPRFARQILTMGLDNRVIYAEVRPYYTETADTAFFDYFDFNTSLFKPYAGSFTAINDAYGFPMGAVPQARSTTSEINMWGIHSMGAGLAFLNPNYAPLQTPDYTEIDALPAVEKPTVVTEPQEAPLPWILEQMTAEDFKAMASSELKAWWATNVGDGREATNATWATLYGELRDSINNYVDYPAKKAAYDQYLIDQENYDAYMAQVKVLRKAAYDNLVTKEQETIDQAILDEQALELSFEGNRFYDLMRRALWYNDNSIMANAVSNRDAAAGAKLMSRQNWYLKWKDKIGY